MRQVRRFGILNYIPAVVKDEFLFARGFRKRTSGLDEVMTVRRDDGAFNTVAGDRQANLCGRSCR